MTKKHVDAQAAKYMPTRGSIDDPDDPNRAGGSTKAMSIDQARVLNQLHIAAGL